MKAPRPETAIAVIAASAVAIVLLVVALIAVFAHKQTSTEKTAQHATTTAQHATHAVAGKASKGALKRTDHTAKVAHASAVSVEHRLTVVRQDFTRVVNVNGLRGLAGRPGINGKDAVLPFTLADIVARIPAPLTGPQGPAGADGKDAPAVTADQVTDAVRPLLPDVVAANCGGSCKGQPGADGAASTVPGPAGADGATGPAGPAGADSTVPGPQGPPGASPTTFLCQPPNPDGTQNCTATG